jgi:hypothetical protein
MICFCEKSRLSFSPPVLRKSYPNPNPNPNPNRNPNPNPIPSPRTPENAPSPLPPVSARWLAPDPRAFLLPLLLLCLAAAPQQYVLHENLHPGQSVKVEFDNHRTVHRISTKSGTSIPTNIEYHQTMIATATILAQTDGSATQMRLYIDPDSHDTQIDKDGARHSGNSFAGKTVTIRRLTDGSVASDFPGPSDPTDLDNLNSFLDPDADFYPDHPVAVGDVWDASANLARHAELGPSDQLMAQCKLDSVTTTHGEQLAQITCSCGTIFQEDNGVEEDVQWTATLTANLSTGQIISSKLEGSSTYSTPPSEPTQVTGNTTFTCTSKVLP